MNYQYLAIYIIQKRCGYITITTTFKMELGYFGTSVNNNNYTIKIYYDFKDIYYKINDIYLASLTNIKPEKHNNILCTKTKSISLCIYRFKQSYDDLAIQVCLLQECYRNHEFKDAVVYGLKWTLEQMQNFMFFKTLDEFDKYIKTDFMKEYKQDLLKTLSNNVKIDNGRFDRIEYQLNELKLNMNVRVPTLQNHIEKVETCYKQLENTVKEYDKKLNTRITTNNNTSNENMTYVKQEFKKLSEQLTSIDEKFDDVYEQIKENYNDIVAVRKRIDGSITINEDEMQIILTPENLLEQSVHYKKTNDLNKSFDIVETIKSMLGSFKFVLSDDFKKNKLDFKDIQFKFKMLTSPENISRDEILAEVFNIDHTVSLI